MKSTSVLFSSQAHHKLDSDIFPELMDNAVRLFDPLTTTLKESMPDFPPLLELMECVKSFLDASKPYIHREQKTTAVEIDNYEQKLKILESQITNLEESQAEL